MIWKIIKTAMIRADINSIDRAVGFTPEEWQMIREAI